MDLNKAPEDEPHWKGVLLRDNKLISTIQCYRTPIPLPYELVIDRYDFASYYHLSDLPTVALYPVFEAGNTSIYVEEWHRFLSYLCSRTKVAIISMLGWELLIKPPFPAASNYRKHPVYAAYRQKHVPMPIQNDWSRKVSEPPVETFQQQRSAVGLNQRKKLPDVVEEPKSKAAPCVIRSFAKTHPSYLETLGQSHASWIFGALAELIDNSRDAQAKRLEISIDLEFFKKQEARIPVLCVADNGTGMSHDDILRMVSFGHKRPDEDNKDVIGRFGVGFKTGAMRLGKDAVVLTQNKETRSIAFLSRSFNEGKDEVEIPIITYLKQGGWMEFDPKVHSQAEAETRLKAVKNFSPFNEYLIGQKFASFGEEGTGTQVYVYNLDRWGSDYTLEWDKKLSAVTGQKSKKCDIRIRSRRVQARAGQTSKEVPLDYSLHAYLEVMFLEPRMKIYIQGTSVKTRPLRKSLNQTKAIKEIFLGKKVELTLGRSQEERDRGNCGIFLYWHGRLVEAYKRVGGMIHTADVGRGVIGVIDVTEIMRIQNGNVGVLNNKQGFLDCEEYTLLERWLAQKALEYWDEYFDPVQVGQKVENAEYTPDHLWVQCNKCLKWRVLEKGVSSEDLPEEWFCYMPPFRGACSMPEVECQAGIVTVGANRTSGYGATVPVASIKDELDVSTTAGNSTVSNREVSDASDGCDAKAVCKQDNTSLKRLKRGPAGGTRASKGQHATSKRARRGD